MKVTITFDTDNAAFEDSFLMAVTKTLSQAKEVILGAHDPGSEPVHDRRLLKDINGNRIGVVELDNRAWQSGCCPRLQKPPRGAWHHLKSW